MPKVAAVRVTTVSRIYLIVALFVAIILGLVLYFQFQMDAAVAVRVFVGGEGLWAKAQKDAILSLERYTATGDEADYQAYLRLIQVPLELKVVRQELEKAQPDLGLVRQSGRQAGLHPVDIEYAIPFFRRFRQTEYLLQGIGHWSRGDQLIAELVAAAEEMHREVAGGRARPAAIRALETRLADINRQLRVEEDQFSAALGTASRWANDVSRLLTYAIALLFAGLGISLSWSIIRRIRLTEHALIESEGRYRGIFERVSDIIYTIGADGTFLSISPSGERMTGWQTTEWLGKHFGDIVHPDDRARAEEVLRKTLAGQPTASIDVRIQRKSGDYVDAEHGVVPLIGGGGVTALLGIARDISERKRMESELRESEQRLRAVLEATVDGILVADTESGKFILGNRAIVDMLGYEPEELFGLGVEDIHPPHSLAEVRRRIDRQLLGELRVAQNVPVQRKDGRIFFADISGSPLMRDGRGYLVSVFHDVTERMRAEEAISQLASTDSLTGIANRRAFIAILERDFERARRDGPAFSIIMYDLDEFKRINDTYGHAVGDDILRGVTDLVKRNIRSADVLARWGGEEFMVLIAEGDTATAEGVAEKLRQTIAAQSFAAVGEVTVSFGVSTFRAGEDMKSLLKRADDALYAAKANGRNRVESR